MAPSQSSKDRAGHENRTRLIGVEARCLADRPDPHESRWGELNPPTLVWRTSMSPQHFTCLAVAEETSYSDPRRRRSAFANPSRRSGGNRTHVRRIKSPLQNHFATGPCRRSSRPLELNQIGSAFNGARRPLRWGGKSAPHAGSRESPHAAQLFHFLGACQGTLHRHHSSIFTEPPAARTGAPRASMHSQTVRAHQSRTNDLDSRSRVRKHQIVSRSRLGSPETTSGRLVSLAARVSAGRGSRQGLEGPPERVVPSVSPRKISEISGSTVAGMQA
jgi:hypothetical protein